jgi:hypothetical protein
MGGPDGDLKPNLGSSAISPVGGGTPLFHAMNWHVHFSDSTRLFVPFFFTPNDALWLAAATSFSAYQSR